jgi:predicted O-linked N-acetylglucosamine transferase (SPINDLY family)
MPEPPSRNQQPLDLTTIQEAVDFHQQGRLREAERLYQAVLQAQPDHFDALHFLGILRAQQGNAEAAVKLIALALEQNPRVAEAHSNLGNALQALGRHDKAISSYDKALAIRPDFADALCNRGSALQALNRHDEAMASYDEALRIAPDHVLTLNNRGNVLQELGRYDEAIASYDKALAIRPGDAEAFNNRGSALSKLNRNEEAIASYDKALAIKPDHVQALNNRGNVLQGLGRYDEAIACYDKALGIKLDYPEAHYNRGNALRELKRHEEALASYDRALALKSYYPNAIINRGNALRDLKRHEEALASYDRALQLEPNSAGALYNRGNVLRDQKRHQEALASYDRALALKPDYHEALYNRGLALRDLKRHEDAAQSFARLLELAPDYDFAKGELLHTRMLCCDWKHFVSATESIKKDIRAGKQSADPFGYQANSDSPQDLRRCAEIYAAKNYPRSQVILWNGERYKNTKIRIGYVSGEFRQQATSILMTELFELHDKNRFELFAFDNGWDDSSEIRGRINRAFDEIVDLARLGDLEAAATMRQRQIDILVNLNGYFGRARQGVFSHKPCPIQVNYLGFPGTLGADYMDYILADPHVIPPEHVACYTEKVVYLPDTYQVNDSKRGIAVRTPTRAEANLPDTGFVFCCFNNNYKITPEIFDIWMRLLNKVQGSVLWLLEVNAAASRNLRRESELRGVAPERLIFGGMIKLEEHVARHRLADLFLDTLPYNAHTTASDALFAGLPLVTCQGTTFPGRVAASLLNAIGLPELIAYNLEEYEALALKLATSPAMLADIRAKLARNRTTHPLFDTDRFRRHIESAYITMWERVQRGEPPVSFAVQHVRQMTPG